MRRSAEAIRVASRPDAETGEGRAGQRVFGSHAQQDAHIHGSLHDHHVRQRKRKKQEEDDPVTDSQVWWERSTWRWGSRTKMISTDPSPTTEPAHKTCMRLRASGVEAERSLSKIATQYSNTQVSWIGIDDAINPRTEPKAPMVPRGVKRFSHLQPENHSQCCQRRHEQQPFDPGQFQVQPPALREIYANNNSDRGPTTCNAMYHTPRKSNHGIGHQLG